MAQQRQTRWLLWGTISFLMGCETMAEPADKLTQMSIGHVMQQAGNCTLGDGYVCQPLDEMTIITNPSNLTPGVYLQAWTTAYADFQALNALTDEQKNLKHYRIGFAENQQNYLVVFSALLLPQINATGETEGLLRTTLGKSMRYELDKQTLSVVSRKYYK